jgi:hypothetical protein
MSQGSAYMKLGLGIARGAQKINLGVIERRALQSLLIPKQANTD